MLAVIFITALFPAFKKVRIDPVRVQNSAPAGMIWPRRAPHQLKGLPY